MHFRKIILAIITILTFSASLSAYELVPVVIEFKGGGELHTAFYCFDELSEGKSIAEERFSVKNFEELSKSAREKIMPVPLGTNVSLYKWAIFSYGEEFWLFEIKNGYLYGRGRLLGLSNKYESLPYSRALLVALA